MTTYLTNDTDLTTVADAIRTKGGTSAALSFPDGFAEAIEDIPTGITPSGNINITTTEQTDVTNYATAQVVDADLVAGNIKKDVEILGVTGNLNAHEEYSLLGNIGLDLTRLGTYPASMSFDLSNITRLSYFISNTNFSGYSSCEDIYFTNAQDGINLNNMLGGVNFIKRFTFIGGVKPSSITSMANRTGSYNPAEFIGEINLSGLTNNPSRAFEHLSSVEIKHNSLSRDINEPYMNTGDIDTVIVQIANGLNETVASKTASFNSYAKNKILALMGTVALDQTSTYHVFTADPSGTVTLADFITNTKGWTLA